MVAHRLFLASFAVLFLALVSSLTQATPQIPLQEADTSINLAMDMQALDTTDNDVQSLAQALNATTWEPVRQRTDLLDTPFQKSELWLKARVSNSGEQPIKRWLELSPWRVKGLDAWILDPDNNDVLDRVHTGLDTPLSERRVNSTRSIVPINLSPGQSATLVLRIHTDTRRDLAITNWDPVAFATDESERYQLHSILLAIILTLFAVLVLQFNLRYFLVGLWMLTLFVLQSEKEGYITYLLLEGISDYSINLRFSSAIIEKALFLIVSVYLLGLRHHRYCRWVIPFATGTAVISTPLGFVLDGNELRLLGSTIHITFALTWPMLLPVALKQPNKWQYPLLGLLALGWTISTIFVVSFAFDFHYPSGLVPARTFVQILVILGLLLVYARQKQDYEKSLEQKLRQREQAERERLEQAVESRTQELNAALESARRANASKTDFLSRVTHDLKSPLTSILGYSQLMRAEQGRAGQMSHIIYNSAHHMLSMVNRLIDYARDVTTVEATVRDLYLHAFMDNLSHEAQVLAGKDGNRFHLERSTALCPVIRCDETFLREILLNLIENACKHTSQGDITLHVTCVELPETERLQLICTIEDSGCGIEPDKQGRLFDPFYRLSDKTEGVGLGLSIVQELVSKLSGNISLSSQPGIGTTVEVTLPVERGQEAADSALLNIPSDMLPRFDANGLTAWVVEDAPAISELLTLELGQLGFAVRVFESAEDIVTALDAVDSTPDLIITDHRLPGASGDEVLRAAKQRNAHMPVILLSATLGIHSSDVSSGAGDYSACLGKPMDLARLRREIARACQLGIDTSAESEPPPTGPQSGPFELNEDTMVRLNQWVELGAVTDLVEWCDTLKQHFPDYANLATEIRQLAERGDFRGISERLTALRQDQSWPAT